MRHLVYLASLVFLVGTLIGCNSDVEVKRDKTKELQITARLKIHEGKLDEFKVLAAKCVQIVKEKDTGTLQYDWFLSQDQSECAVRETYVDSDALLQHMTNLGEAMGALFATGDFSAEVYGNPSDELIKATEGLDVVVYSYFQGL